VDNTPVWMECLTLRSGRIAVPRRSRVLDGTILRATGLCPHPSQEGGWMGPTTDVPFMGDPTGTLSF